MSVEPLILLSALGLLFFLVRPKRDWRKERKEETEEFLRGAAWSERARARLSRIEESHIRSRAIIDCIRQGKRLKPKPEPKVVGWEDAALNQRIHAAFKNVEKYLQDPAVWRCEYGLGDAIGDILDEIGEDYRVAVSTPDISDYCHDLNVRRVEIKCGYTAQEFEMSEEDVAGAIPKANEGEITVVHGGVATKDDIRRDLNESLRVLESFTDTEGNPVNAWAPFTDPEGHHYTLWPTARIPEPDGILRLPGFDYYKAAKGAEVLGHRNERSDTQDPGSRIWFAREDNTRVGNFTRIGSGKSVTIPKAAHWIVFCENGQYRKFRVKDTLDYRPGRVVWTVDDGFFAWATSSSFRRNRVKTYTIGAKSPRVYFENRVSLYACDPRWNPEINRQGRTDGFAYLDFRNGRTVPLNGVKKIVRKGNQLHVCR